MKMVPQLADVQGRVLPAPVLAVGGQDNRFTPRDGSWDMRNKQFYNSMRVDCWAIVLFLSENSCRADAVRHFASTFKSVASREGLRVTSDPVVVKYERPNKVRVYVCEKVYLIGQERNFYYIKARFPLGDFVRAKRSENKNPAP